MVHKTKEPAEDWLERQDREWDAEQRDYERRAKQEQKEFEQTLHEAEATAKATYETMLGLGRGAQRAVEVGKTGVRKVSRGVKQLSRQVRGVKPTQWFEREPIRVGISPEMAEKRKEEEKKYVTLEEE